MGKLTDALALLNQRINANDTVLGRIGMRDPVTGLPIIQAPARPLDYVLVQMLTGAEAGTIRAARNLGVAPLFGTEVRLKKDAKLPNEYVITEVDPNYLAANPTRSIASVPPHRHYIGSGLDDPVEIRRIIPGRTWSRTGLTITVDAFNYKWLGTDYQFAGVTDYDITSYLPSSGYHLYIKVGIDPDTNALLIVSGSAILSTIALAFSNIQSVTFNGIESAAIPLEHTQTYILDTSVVDLRNLLSDSVSSGGDYQQDIISSTVIIPANCQGNYAEEVIIKDGGELIVEGRLYIL